jgi:hypothetical protein
MHKNVPPKFNQICRLCLTLVGDGSNSDCDEIVKKLSIFKSNNTKQPKQGKHQSIDDDEQLNKKVKRSNEISVSLSGSSDGNVINNGFSSANDIDFHDAKFDMTKRISQCLSIQASENDGLPPIVCVKCREQLDSCHRFRRAAHRTQQALLDYLQFTSKLNGTPQVSFKFFFTLMTFFLLHVCISYDQRQR